MGNTDGMSAEGERVGCGDYTPSGICNLKMLKMLLFPLGGNVTELSSAAYGMPELSPSQLNWAVGLFNIVAVVYWKHEVLALWRKSEGCIALAVQSV